MAPRASTSASTSMSDSAPLVGKPIPGLRLGFFGRLWQWLPDHKSLAGYLERRTILKLGRLHIRYHRILSEDKTPFLHTHPFAYVSIILRGGYTEQTETGMKHYARWSVISRSSSTYHRLESVLPGTLTLFITWEKAIPDWRIKRPLKMPKLPGWIDYKPGIYQRELYGRVRLCKFDGFWHTAADTVEAARASLKPSIDQKTAPLLPMLE